MPGFDEKFPYLIEGRSLIKKNAEVITDLNEIRSNNLTILSHINISEGIPPKEGSSKIDSSKIDSSKKTIQ